MTLFSHLTDASLLKVARASGADSSRPEDNNPRNAQFREEIALRGLSFDAAPVAAPAHKPDYMSGGLRGAYEAPHYKVRDQRAAPPRDSRQEASDGFGEGLRRSDGL
jgi:hypothetical protein